MKRDNQSLVSQILEAAKNAGADGADAMLTRGHNTSVTVRLGKVEAIDRSESFDIGLRVFVGRRTATVSTTNVENENIKELVERALDGEYNLKMRSLD